MRVSLCLLCDSVRRTRITCALGQRHSGPSARVAEPGGDTVDGQVDPALDALVARVRFFAAAMTLDQLDLQMVERIEIRKAIADVARERRIGLEQMFLA